MAFLLLLAWMVDILGCGSGRSTFEDFGVQFEFNSRNTDYICEYIIAYKSALNPFVLKSWEATSLAKQAAQTLQHLNSKTKSKHKSCGGTSISQKAPSKHINHWTHLPGHPRFESTWCRAHEVAAMQEDIRWLLTSHLFSTKNTEKYCGHLGSPITRGC